MKKLCAIIFLLVLLTTIGEAQNFSFSFRNAPRLLDSTGNELQIGFAGGLNAPQFSKVHLNEDLILDLVVFDRTSNRLLTFIADNTQPEGWRYEPYFIQFFPTDLESWVLMRDYDGDGKADIFSVNNRYAGIKVYRNITFQRGQPQFQKVDTLIQTTLFSGRATPLTINSGDLPGIGDVDGDGDLDIINQEITGSGFEWHKNMSIETFGNASHLKFEKITNCFGGVFAGASCGNYTYATCRENRAGDTVAPPAPTAVNHLGASVLIAELNGDGKQDAVLGDVSCTQAYFFPNNSTTGGYVYNNRTTSYPEISSQGRVGLFTASFNEDLDNDGVKDFLVACNTPDEENFTYLQKNSNLLYKNLGTNSSPNFQFQRNSFLYQEMLDLGSWSKPAVGDVDADGDPDIIIGAKGYAFNGSGTSGLTYLQNNNGTFRLITSDWQNLARNILPCLQPEFADLNSDSKPDLVLHFMNDQVNRTFTIKVLFNQAATGQAWRFDTTQSLTLTSISNINANDSPTFFDVDEDGKTDLLLGKNTGRIQYYRNTGTATLPAFTLTAQRFGLLDYADSFGYNLSPAVADFNGDNVPDLLTTDNRGYIAFYPNIRNGINSSLDPVDRFYRPTISDTTRPIFLGKNLHPASIDFNGDGQMDLAFGTPEGGLLLLTNTRTLAPLSSNEIDNKSYLQVWPNPAKTTLQIAGKGASNYSITDLSGRVITSGILNVSSPQTISVESLAGGMYLFIAGNEVRRFVKE